MIYCNDNDPSAVRWMHHLMNEGFVEEGVIDGRSIKDVDPDDIRWFDRCHFFAGILGWELALQLAGWPVDIPVWTASLPCQPFSICAKLFRVVAEEPVRKA